MRRNVTFKEEVQVHLMIVWTFAYQDARKGTWEQHARDRERFKLKIFKYSPIISYALEQKVKNFTSKSCS